MLLSSSLQVSGGVLHPRQWWWRAHCGRALHGGGVRRSDARRQDIHWLTLREVHCNSPQQHECRATVSLKIINNPSPWLLLRLVINCQCMCTRLKLIQSTGRICNSNEIKTGLVVVVWWWLFGGGCPPMSVSRSSVVEHWQLTPEALGLISGSSTSF